MGEGKAKTTATQRALHASEIRAEPPSSFAGRVPATQEEARDLVARAIAEMTLQPESLKAFRRLLRDKDHKIRLEAWRVSKEIMEGRKDLAPAKPTQVIVNNLVARPAKDVTPKTVNADAVKVEVLQ